MARSVVTFLMFEGAAEAAVQLYAETFGVPLGEIVRWTEGEAGKPGSIKRAELAIAGHALVAMDSPVHHQFTFTPSTSLFVECESAAELERAFARLSEGGGVLMPLGNYGFSTQFAWVNDRFGVSWQLNLA